MSKIFKKKLFKDGDYSEYENIKFNCVLIDEKLINQILTSVMDLNNNNLNLFNKENKSNKELIDNNLGISDLNNNNNNFINNVSNKSCSYFTRSNERKFSINLKSNLNGDDKLSNYHHESNYLKSDKFLKGFNFDKELDRMDKEVRAEVRECPIIKDLDRILESIKTDAVYDDLDKDIDYDINYDIDYDINSDIDNRLNKESYEENNQNKLNTKRAFDEIELIDDKIEEESNFSLRKKQKLDDEKSKETRNESIDEKTNNDFITEEEIESDYNDLTMLYSKLNYTTLEDDLELTDDSDNENQTHSKLDLKNDDTTLKDIYKAEKILAKRYNENGKLEYLVKYTNLDDDQLSWEDEKTLDNKLKYDFNEKYGDKLLLEDISKESRSIYLDKHIDKDVLVDEYKEANYDLKELINKSINKPLCDIYNNIKPECIYGIFEFENVFYYLVKWKNLDKADVFECSKFKERFPEIVYDYYQSRISFNQLVERKASAPLKHDKRVFLSKK